MFREERHQAALDRQASLLAEAAAEHLRRQAPAAPSGRRPAVQWRTIEFTLRLPVLFTRREA